MDHRFFSFVWRYSKRDQLVILALTFTSFPLVYISLEIPKIIINEAISGTDFPKEILGMEFEQVPYLLALCGLFLLMIVLINGIKWLMNVQIGMTGERMLRRLRFMLFERVMRFRIARFRTTKPGEIIQSILGEIEPLGGFIGEVIATPCFQGGLLTVYVTFIFVQDWALGLAAVALYPLQAFLIPKLQAKIVRLNKDRARNTRVLADTIGEGVTLITEVHTNDTARWHLSQVAGRLYENTVIRLQLFKRKFTIKFINNFLNQLTPFFFYSAGGYAVIRGDLDFGSLVAVLAAYKDVAAPWKAILNYFQRWTDFNSRYAYVVENFSGEDVLEPERLYADGAQAQPLTGTLSFSGVEGGAGTGGLTITTLDFKPGEVTAVAGGASGGREALLKLAAGLQAPAAGQVTLGGRSLSDATLPQVGAAVSYIGSEPGIISRTLRDNLLYGLFRGTPNLADAEDAVLANMLVEARLTGNSTANPEGDWVDYAMAGVGSAEELDERVLEIVEQVGLEHEIYSGALDMRLDAERAQHWAAPVMEARTALEANLDELEDVIEFWDLETYNRNASLLENALYALPVAGRENVADYVQDADVIAVLDEFSGTETILAIGWHIACEFSELIEAVEADSAVLATFAGYSRSEILAASELVVGLSAQPPKTWSADQKRLLLSLAFGFVQNRDRLDVLDDDRVREILAFRKRAHETLVARDDFVSFTETRFNPARTVAGNILPGARRADRTSAWKRLDSIMEEKIADAGLRDDLILLGLTRPMSASGSLSAATKRRIGLARAIIKRAHLVVMDGIASGDNEADADLRARLRALMPDAIVLYAAAEEGATAGADQIVRIPETGTVRVEAGTPLDATRNEDQPRKDE